MSQKTKTLVRAAVLCAVLCVTAQIVIPIGPVPFSMAVFGVALVGALLPRAAALGSLGCYLALGLFGLPVFAGFKAGPGALFGVTGGYLLGYFALAFCASLAMARPRPWVARLALCAVGLCGMYLFGTLWFMVLTGAGFWAALAACVAPFALADALKTALALALAAALQKRLAA